MATSGTLTGSDGYQGRVIQFTWERTSYSVADNTSTISWTLKGDGTASSGWYYAGNFKVVIAGDTEYESSTRIKLYDGTTVASGTKKIKHNSDGTKSFSVSIKAGIYEVAVNCTGSKTFTLDTIPRASSVSATSAYIGNASTITISRASSSFTHTLTYTFGSLSGTIATKTSSTSVSFTLPDSFYAEIGSTATSKSGTITCTTYNGSTSLGSKTASFTARTNSTTCAPTLSPTAVDSNTTTVALTGDDSKFIKYYSNAIVATGATAKNGATLKSYKISCGSKSITTSSGVINKVESGSFTFSATDSRGYTTTKTLVKTLINYIKLSCSLKAEMTVDGVATFTAKGNYFNGSFGAVSNTLTVQYRYMVSGGTYSSWTNMTATKSGNTYTATGTISDLDYKSTYQIQVRAVDKLATVTPEAVSVNALPVFDWGEDDFNFNVAVGLQNNLRINGTTTDGEVLNAFQPCNGNNNCVLGYGGHANEIGATNIYGNDVNVLTNYDFSINDGENVYSILGAMKAMTTNYTFDCTVTLGDNYTSGSASANIIGNNLRMYMTAKRSSNASVGDITNEVIMKIKVTHGGKKGALYAMGTVNASTGAPVSMYSNAGSAVDDGKAHEFELYLTGVAVADNEWSAYWVVPARLNLAAYV